ncbi:hypothetical protein ACFLS9_06225 [Bacteroidota bacterium]
MGLKTPEDREGDSSGHRSKEPVLVTDLHTNTTTSAAKCGVNSAVKQR